MQRPRFLGCRLQLGELSEPPSPLRAFPVSLAAGGEGSCGCSLSAGMLPWRGGAGNAVVVAG